MSSNTHTSARRKKAVHDGAVIAELALREEGCAFNLAHFRVLTIRRFLPPLKVDGLAKDN